MDLETYQNVPKWERKLGEVFPTWLEGRMKARHRAFRYEAAMRSRLRNNATGSNQNPESSITQRDAIQMMWDSRDLAENSPICKSILDKVELYAFGRVRYQAKTGDPVADKEYNDLIKDRSKRVNVRENMSLRRFTQMVYRSAFRDGDMGIQPIETDEGILMNPIEADRIGNPRTSLAFSKTYVRGLTLDPVYGRIEWAEIYERSDSGLYINPIQIPGAQFWHIPLFNRFDQWRGVPGFYACLTRLRDLAETFGMEITAVKWASSVAGLIVRKAGLASVEEEDFYNDALPSAAPEARASRLQTVEPGKLEYLEEGEDLKQFVNARPAAAWQGFLQMMIRDISISGRLPYSFTYDASGVQGTALRLDSMQARRSFTEIQETAEEQFLDPWSELQLADGISKGLIRPTPNWKGHSWRYAAHPTVDIGRESAANLSENRQAVRSGNMIAAEEGGDIYEIHEECANEAANIIRLAKEKNVPVSMIMTLSKDGNAQNDPIQGVPGDPTAYASPSSPGPSQSFSLLYGDSSSRRVREFERKRILEALEGVEIESPEWDYLTTRLQEVTRE